MKEEAGVTIEDVRRVAELANLELTAEEEPRMQRDLNAILGHIAQLNELDTAGVPAEVDVSGTPKDSNDALMALGSLVSPSYDLANISPNGVSVGMPALANAASRRELSASAWS